MFKENKKLEKELRYEWEMYLRRSHPEDAISFMDYCYDLGLFKGYKIKVDMNDWFETVIKFKK